MADSPDRKTARSLPGLGGVEPAYHSPPTSRWGHWLTGYLRVLDHRTPFWLVLVLMTVALSTGLWLGSSLLYPPLGQVVSVCEDVSNP